MSLGWGEVTHLQCGNCGIEFYVPTHWYEARAVKGEHDKRFVCPNGHPRVFSTSEVERLRRERDHLKQQLAQRDDEIVQRDKTIKKMKRRSAAGTCPCCQRSFANMGEHMRKQHPEYVAEQTQKEIPPEDKVVPIRGRRKKA